MKINSLYELAARNGIQVDHVPLPENRSVSVLQGKDMFIALDSGISTRAEERVCLAHELGHCETMSFYNMYSKLEVRGKHENRADRWAITKLIPRDRYYQALHNGYIDIPSLAEFFDVTEDFMRKVTKYYGSM